MNRTVTNWGNYPVVESEVYSFARIDYLLKNQYPVTIRGMGRSYGDASLGKVILDMTKNHYFLDFDEEKGILTCEAGVTIEEILKVFVPRGWFVPVTPGTKFVTVGGAISADVHGKNHHKEGSFCKHVLEVEVLLANGKRILCGPEKNTELFQYICGGMGLLGVITKATIRLKKIETAYIKQTVYKAKNLEEMLELFEASKDSPYTVAWMDCLAQGSKLGRGILFTGDHASIPDLPESLKKEPLRIPEKKKFRIPFYFPSFVLNPVTVQIFNFFYYHKQWQKVKTNIIDYDTFFYPLDSLLEWNKIYGRRGFLQYQFVLPRKTGLEGTKEIIRLVAKEKLGSFLVVFKLFGNPDAIPQAGAKKPVRFPFSFPEEGFTLALDFPMHQEIEKLLEKLDSIVLQYGGKLYLAKDARMKRELFHRTYPVANFLKVKRKYDPNGKFSSMLAERLDFILVKEG